VEPVTAQSLLERGGPWLDAANDFLAHKRNRVDMLPGSYELALAAHVAAAVINAETPAAPSPARSFFELHDLLQRYGDVLRPESYLEVGVCKGASLECLLSACTPSRIVLCDNWSYDPQDERLCREKFNLPSVKFLTGNSHVILKTLHETFDLITVDSDHSLLCANEDLEDVWPLLNTGGFLLFDDICHPDHPYLIECIRAFVHRHLDTRCVCELTYGGGSPGCAVVKKCL